MSNDEKISTEESKQQTNEQEATPPNQTTEQVENQPKEGQEPEKQEEPEPELTPEEKLQKEVERLQKEVESYRDKYMRAEAKASNIRRQVKRDAEVSNIESKKRILKGFLDIKDNLDRGLQAMEQAALGEDAISHLEGLKLISQQMTHLFEVEGIKEMKVKGEMYDLTRHEVISRVPYDGPANRVIDVVQTGYTLNGKVLREAKVVISMKKEPPKKEDKKKEEEPKEEQSTTEVVEQQPPEDIEVNKNEN